MHVLIIFVDGLGLGEDDPEINPVVRAETSHFDRLLGGRRLVRANGIVRSDVATMVPTDATLGVSGLPQSATGQTTLLTGLNAPKLVGRHVQAYPTKALREMLVSQSLFGQLRRRGLDVALANAYTQDYFQLVAARRLREGAITLAARASGLPLRGVKDLLEGRAIFHDLTHEVLRRKGFAIPLRTPEEAGRVLASVGSAHHLTLFEFFLTDLVAHGRLRNPDILHPSKIEDFAGGRDSSKSGPPAKVKKHLPGYIELDPEAVVARLDRFVGAAVEASDLDDTLIILTSDHGNIEDSRTPVHTRNPVPTLVIGEKREEVAERISDLTHLTPAIVRLFSS